MTEMIKVRAAGGLSVPKEGRPHEYIGAAAAEVPATAYYLRAIAEGDLVRVETVKKGVKDGV